MGPLIAQISQVMQTALGAERVYLCSFGEVVTHVHLFLLPRYRGMPTNGGGAF
jgi:diadenosine tetraphosphate (Ap4A) HIT family hydrolase